MPRNRAIGGLSGPLADHDLPADEALAARANPGARDTQGAAGPQARSELAGQRAAALHEQRLVDRLVRDPHARIIGEVDLQPGRDLLRAPRPRPAAVLATRLVAALPRLDRWPRNRGPVAAPDVAGEAILHVLAQSRVGRELGRLWAAGHQLGLPLRHRRPVLQLAASRRRVASQLARDRRRRAAEITRDRAHTLAFGTQQGDLLTLGKAQVPARLGVAQQRRHPATLTKPPDASRRRHPDRGGRILAAQTLGDLPPEPELNLAPVRTAYPATSSANAPSTPASNQPACPSPPHLIEVLRRPRESAPAC